MFWSRLGTDVRVTPDLVMTGFREKVPLSGLPTNRG